MWSRITLVLLALCGIWTASRAEIIGGGVYGVFKPSAGGGCAPATTFLARTQGGNYNGNAQDVTAVTTFMCGLVTDGLLTSAGSGYCGTLFDLIYVYAVNNSTDALLNLCSSSFNATVTGAPTFNAHVGFTNTDGNNGGVYIDTGFNASIAGGNYTQNAAHQSMWINSNSTSTGAGGFNGALSSAISEYLIARYSDTKSYFRINDAATASTGVTVGASSVGYFLGNRDTSTTQQGYYNGVAQTFTPATTSGALINLTHIDLAVNSAIAGHPNSGDGHQHCMLSLGGKLTSGQVTSLYNRLNTLLHTSESC